MPIPVKSSKFIVKSGDGLVQILPETSVDEEILAESPLPVSSGAVYGALEETDERLNAMGRLEIMTEEPSQAEADGMADETLIAVMEPDYWTFKVDTHSGTKTAVPFNLYGQYSTVLTVDWGDGTSSVLNSSAYAQSDGHASIHEYAAAGQYTVRVFSNDWPNTYITTSSSNTNQCYALSDESENMYLYYWRTTLVETSPLPKVKGSRRLGPIAQTTAFIAYDNSFEDLFLGCSYLQTVPEDLFESNSSVTNFASCFKECIRLESIPERLFYDNAAATRFDYCFIRCTSLQSIPENLFCNNASALNFSYLFYSCSSVQSIPENLFKYNPLATTFYRVFAGCSSVQSIPENLFYYNTEVTNFAYAFSSCSSVQSIPEWLFRNNANVTSYEYCFYECSGIDGFVLHIPSRLVTSANSFVSSKDGVERILYLPTGGRTWSTFYTANSSMGLTLIHE